MPEPEGPITAVNVPGAKSVVTPSSAVTARAPEPYTLRTDRRVTPRSVLVSVVVVMAPQPTRAARRAHWREREHRDYTQH
ncbi:hypothetical protein GCM10023259_037540 [Thermocatellispora tengchongensis]